MPQPEFEALEREVRDLANRVAFLEERAGLSAAAAPPESMTEFPSGHPLAGMPAILPLVGRSLLGIAGAYLLRALTEAGVLPARVGVAAGIVYALLWLSWAARSPSKERLKTAVRQPYCGIGAIAVALGGDCKFPGGVALDGSRDPAGLCGFRHGDFVA